jgi:transcriptional regulator with XRE-family HTH domain
MFFETKRILFCVKKKKKGTNFAKHNFLALQTKQQHTLTHPIMIHIGDYLKKEIANQRYTLKKVGDAVGLSPQAIGKQLRNKDLNTDDIMNYQKLLKVNVFYRLACLPELKGYALPKVENPLPAPTFASDPKIEYTTKAVKTETNDDHDLVSITITMPRHKSEKILEILQSK